MQISQRVQAMSEPALLKYYPLVNEAKKKGKKVYYLNIGQPDIKTPKKFMDKITGISKDVLAYEAPEGTDKLRKAACEYYRRHNLRYDVEDLLITNGGSEALLFTLLTICNPGDEIITAEPLYSIYKEMAAASSVNIKGFKTYTEDNFDLPDKEVLRKCITAKTKAIIITSPGNPTGKVYTRQEVEMIRDLAIEYGLYIISDEVYREFIYEGEYVSPGHYPELDDYTIITDSISKRYSACGARIGFILSKNKTFIYQVRKLCQMRLAVSSVDQSGAVELFKLDNTFFKEIITEYTHRRNIVYDCLKSIDGVIAKKAKGAFYCIAKLPVKNACDFIEWMITNFDDCGETVLLSPANDFYINPEDGTDEVRIAYVLEEQAMRTAMSVLKHGIEAYVQAFPEKCK